MKKSRSLLYNELLANCHKKAVVIMREEYWRPWLEVFINPSCSMTNSTNGKFDEVGASFSTDTKVFSDVAADQGIDSRLL